MISPRARLIVALAATAIAATPVATAQASTAKRATHLSAHLSHSSVHVGSVVQLTGKLTPHLGRRHVSAQALSNHHWRTTATSATTSSGAYTFTLRPGAVGSYRYRVIYKGDSTTKSTSSPATTLNVTRIPTALTATLTATAVRQAVPASLSGKLTPALAHQRISVQRAAAGRWVTVGSTLTSSAGSWSFAVPTATAATTSYRSSYAGSSTRSTANSPTRALTVAPSTSLRASGYLGGTADPTLPVGAPNTVSVLTHGALTSNGYSADIPVVVRNNMATTRINVEVTGSVRDSSGHLVATGTADVTTPARLTSGTAVVAMVSFDDLTSVPAEYTVSFSVTSDAVSSDYFGRVSLQVTETNNTGSAIVGAARNSSGAKVSGPYRVEVYCFAGSTLTNDDYTYADQDSDGPAGGQVTFTDSFFDAQTNASSCSNYLVGVNGWSF